ncbi:hypothetical protein QE439_002405 [Pedobacter agri]|nr:hypothetical protein [Pedobacter agri]
MRLDSASFKLTLVRINNILKIFLPALWKTGKKIIIIKKLKYYA